MSTATQSTTDKSDQKVLITGASRGIGATYAKRFAKRGYQLVLVARSEEKLTQVAADIREETGVNVEIMPADLTLAADIARVAEKLNKDTQIEILVNNAGIAQRGNFTQQTPELISELIQLNVNALTQLAAAVAPRFVEQGNGSIINIGSVVGLAPEFGATLYGASKAYVQFLSQSLHQELSPSGVYVQAVLPATTRTDIWAYSGIDVNTLPEVMEVEELVDAALVGFDRKETVTIPPLHAPECWDELQAVRMALLGGLKQDEPAERYTTGR